MEEVEGAGKVSIWKKKIKGVWPFFLFLLFCIYLMDIYTIFFDRSIITIHQPQAPEQVILTVGILNLLGACFIVALWRKRWWGLYGAVSIGFALMITYYIWKFPIGFILNLIAPIFYFSEARNSFDTSDRLALRAQKP